MSKQSKKIETLTAAQIARFTEFVERWTQIGLCTDPADRPRAEAAIAQSYRCAGLEPPKKIVWCGSPLSAGLTRAIVLDKKLMDSVRNSVWNSVLNSVGNSVLNSVLDSVGNSVWDSVRKSVEDSVLNSVWNSVGNSVLNSVEASVRDSVGNSVLDSVGNSVVDSVWNSVLDSVWNSVLNSVEARVLNSVLDSVWNSVLDSVWNSVLDSVGNSVRDSVGNSVWDSVRNSVEASVLNSVLDSVWNSVLNSVRNSVLNSVRDSVGNSVRASVLNSVEDSVWDSVRNSVEASVYGQHDVSWLAFYHFFREVCGLTRETEKLIGLFDLAQSANWVIPHRNICWVSERHHILRRDERGRLHCLAGPAVMYPDGWAIYAVHGVRVPQAIVEQPDKITAKEVLDEKNAEIRRVMIEQMGLERFTHDAHLKAAHSDYTGTLYRVDDIAFVEVVNGSPEPDGSFRHYFLACDPQARTALEAVASSFGVSPDAYKRLHPTMRES